MHAYFSDNSKNVRSQKVFAQNLPLLEGYRTTKSGSLMLFCWFSKQYLRINNENKVKKSDAAQKNSLHENSRT